ncbi:integrase catalytic domain-containing protein [Trichonephila clavipes]|nr:integrase catalytic domain-containing protein [Trichonephila clavipes]
MESKSLPYEKHPKYLGYILDPEILSNKHIDYVINKGRKRLDLLKYVAGRDWGADAGTLRLTYTSLIRPVLDKEETLEIQSPFSSLVGGLWERLIRMLKTILRKVLARVNLNQEEMTTVLCDAESVLNSRPLTYISEDPDELFALSPSVFLQEIREVGVSNLDYIDSKKLNKRFLCKQKYFKT